MLVEINYRTLKLIGNSLVFFLVCTVLILNVLCTFNLRHVSTGSLYCQTSGLKSQSHQLYDLGEGLVVFLYKDNFCCCETF